MILFFSISSFNPNLFYFIVFNLVLNLYFCFLLPFYISVISFQFNPSILNFHIFLFLFGLYSLDFFFFSLNSFIKVLLAFNLTIQSKFMVCYFFQFYPHYFLFLFLFKLFFFSVNPSIEKT